MTQERRSKKPIGELLVSEGLLTQGELLDALANRTVVDGRRERLGETILRLGFVDGLAMAKVIAEQFGARFAGEPAPTPTPDAVGAVDEALVRRHRIIPLHVEDGPALAVLTSDPSELTALEEVRVAAGAPDLVVVVGSAEQVSLALAQAYGETDAHSTAGAGSADWSAAEDLWGAQQAEDPGRAQGRSAWADVPVTPGPPAHDQQATMPAQPTQPTPPSIPALGLLERLLADAVTTGATQVKLEPSSAGTVIRMRVDGAYRDASWGIDADHSQVVATLAEAVGLPAGDHPRPRSATATYEVDGSQIGLTVLLIPGVSGTTATLTLAVPATEPHDLDLLGLTEEDAWLVRNSLAQRGGLVLISGPARSGRTATLHGLLADRAAADGEAVLLTDRATRPIPGTTQVLVPAHAIAEAIDSLRPAAQDVLAIDGAELSRTASDIARTLSAGTTVIATVDALDAAATIAALHFAAPTILDSVVPPVIISQRLLRSVCGDCASEHSPDPEEQRSLGLVSHDEDYVQAAGCDACGHSGYRGQTAVTEIAAADAEIAGVLHAEGSAHAVRATLRRQGVASLRQQGLAKARDGKTTLADVRLLTPADAASGGFISAPSTTPPPAQAVAPSAGLPLPRRAPGREDTSAAAGMFGPERTRAADESVDVGEAPISSETGRLDPEKALQTARARLDQLLQGVD